MATTFARLCQQVDITQKHLEEEIARLSKEIDQLEKIQNNSKLLRYLNFFFSIIWTFTGLITKIQLCKIASKFMLKFLAFCIGLILIFHI